jgi:hypothetical protein
MVLSDQMRAAFVAGPILGLILVGLLVSLRSGPAPESGERGVRLLVGNLSRVLIRVFGYLAGFLAIQQLVGFPTGLVW